MRRRNAGFELGGKKSQKRARGRVALIPLALIAHAVPNRVIGSAEQPRQRYWAVFVTGLVLPGPQLTSAHGPPSTSALAVPRQDRAMAAPVACTLPQRAEEL